MLYSPDLDWSAFGIPRSSEPWAYRRAYLKFFGGKNDPPYPLKKGETGSEVPLLKGDLGGSS